MAQETTTELTMEFTWSNTIGVYLAVLESGTNEGKTVARAELTRMAKIADCTKDALTLLERAESFIAGFEDDDEQEGVKELLKAMRKFAAQFKK